MNPWNILPDTSVTLYTQSLELRPVVYANNEIHRDLFLCPWNFGTPCIILTSRGWGVVPGDCVAEVSDVGAPCLYN